MKPNTSKKPSRYRKEGLKNKYSVSSTLLKMVSFFCKKQKQIKVVDTNDDVQYPSYFETIYEDEE